ncbi:MAG: PLP-dependent transferase, partial [Actinobacteria bacterium]|nr:PLP-dependent transferase [Actinomycetota bacterium]
MENLRPESVAVAAGRPEAPGSPLNAPIVLAAPYRQDGGGQHPYGRADVSATLQSFEAALGALEGGTALGFASGMAAVAAVVEGRPAGCVAVVPVSAYTGTVGLFAEQAALGLMQVRPVDLGDTAAVVAALDGADLLWLETVTNPLLAVPDV